MTLTEKAMLETCSENTTAHHGGGPGRPFWNAEARQFMYVPAFQFPPVPGAEKYLYSAEDECSNEYSFTSDSACSLLTPIWKNLHEGFVRLQVYSLDAYGNKQHLIGARTFFKLAPFSEDLPGPDCSYRECALKAFDYAYNSRIVSWWLDHDYPYPNYDLNVYPSKMISSIVVSMIRYADICPERAESCIRIAINAADYLISVTEPDGKPLAGLPPTYYTDFRVKDETMNDLTAEERKDTIMMFYPASAGSAYLLLEKKTGIRKYFDAAYEIADYYRKNVLENGSWHLVVSKLTGEPAAENFCMSTNAILPFLTEMYQRTGEEDFRILAENALKYVENGALKTYHWEGQFEDSVLSSNYSNLCHGDCDKLIIYYSAHYPDDKEKMAAAKELMRYVEDQFVVWKRPCPWDKCGFDVACWPTPCALEQYNWYVPVDASTAVIASAFLSVYKATGEELYMAKALALMNTITRVQNKKDGRIPTEWMVPDFIDGAGKDMEFWLNCLFYSACVLTDFADFVSETEA